MRGNLRDTMVAHINNVATNASDEDKQAVASLVDRAKAHANNPAYVFETMTPAMAALFWLKHNVHNREWVADWSSELAGIMRDGGWRMNTPQGYALFGDDGSLGDGSHRAGAQAYSDTTLTNLPIYLGMSKTDVGALDNNKKRTAADLGELNGVVNAKDKVSLMRAIWSYEKAVGIRVPVQEHNLDAIVTQVKENDALLARALELGQVSLHDMSEDQTLLSEKAAARVIGILLRHSWPEDKVTNRIDEVQTQDFTTDAPLAIARRFIEKHRRPADLITVNGETGVLVKAVIIAETQQSVNLKGRREIESASRGTLPNPAYPQPKAEATGAEDNDPGFCSAAE